MSTDQDKTLKMMVQALHDWWVSMGDFASVLFAVLLVVIIAAMLLLLRWIWGGGLSRQNGFGFFRHSRVVDESAMRDFEL